jgi:uncharacterized coiled-coil protein SlyX
MFGFANKYIVYGVIALIASAIIATYIYSWKASIRREALLEFNNNQLEQTIREQEKTIANMKAITDSQRVIIDSMQKKNEEVSKQLAEIEEYLNSEEVKKTDRPTSSVIKETIRRLSGQK